MGLVCAERRCEYLGRAIIEQVVAALKDAGFRTQRAYPGTEMPNITQVVAAVQLAEEDIQKQKTVVDVKLLCPQHLGAQACEDAAFTAAEKLEKSGLSCAIGPAKFDGRSGLFCISCVATKQPEEQIYLDVPFKIGAVEQFRVVSFTAQQIFDEAVAAAGRELWKVRLEQFFYNGSEQDSDPDGDQFTITNNKEIYHGCEWTSRSRVTELDGTRQIREGTAMYRTVLA